ncbi:MAG: DoxX family protein [Gammaproteobacteria bacterium]|nr:DoxX family protein [Gammaproteobacteria bacterium]
MENLSQGIGQISGADVLRVVCGLFFIPHLVVKFRNQDFVKGFMSRAGLNPPTAWLYMAFAVEIVVTIGLVFDVLTLYAGLLAGVFLLVASWASWRVSEGKWMWNFGGAEYPLFWGICCFVVAMQA